MAARNKNFPKAFEPKPLTGPETSRSAAKKEFGLSLVEHDLVGKPVPTFPDHARAKKARRQWGSNGGGLDSERDAVGGNVWISPRRFRFPINAWGIAMM
jgi:hypothetical protein